MPCAGDDRLEARLQALPHAALVEALAACMTDGRPAAEACVAKHLPLPEWARSGVLLSEHLLPCVFASLAVEDGAAAAVCSSWRQAWRETDDGRRGLRSMEELEVPFEANGLMSAHPSGRWLAMG